MIRVVIAISMQKRSRSKWMSNVACDLKLLTMSSSLSLICLMAKGNSVENRVLIEYNVTILRDAVVQMFKV